MEYHLAKYFKVLKYISFDLAISFMERILKK